MNPHAIIALVLLYLCIIGILVVLIHLNVVYFSRFGHLESTQSIWPNASKKLLKPSSWPFLLYLVYGIGFNSLIRSLLYSVLQFVNVMRANQSLGIVGEFIISCICTFVGSFAASTLYKLEEGSIPEFFSGALAICVVPTGMSSLIITEKSRMFPGIIEVQSVEFLVIWALIIAAFSGLASFIVFRYITLSYSMLSNYSLKQFEFQPVPNNSHETTQQNSSVHNSIQQNSTKPNRSKKRSYKCRAVCLCLIAFFFFYMPPFIIRVIVDMNTYGDWTGRKVKEMSYLTTVLVNVTQFTCLMGYAVFTIYVQSQLVAAGVSVKNWCWYVLFSNLPGFLFNFLIDTDEQEQEYKYENEVLLVEMIRVPFKLAAVGFIASAIYYIVCLKRARKILIAAEPQELDAFVVDDPETA